MTLEACKDYHTVLKRINYKGNCSDLGADTFRSSNLFLVTS